MALDRIVVLRGMINQSTAKWLNIDDLWTSAAPSMQPSIAKLFMLNSTYHLAMGYPGNLPQSPARKAARPRASQSSKSTYLEHLAHVVLAKWPRRPFHVVGSETIIGAHVMKWLLAFGAVEQPERPVRYHFLYSGIFSPTLCAGIAFRR